jgi:hypothetical protein
MHFELYLSQVKKHLFLAKLWGLKGFQYQGLLGRGEAKNLAHS